MLNVHRGVPKKFDELHWTYKCLIVGTFPVWGPVSVVPIVAFTLLLLVYETAVASYEGLRDLFSLLWGE